MWVLDLQEEQPVLTDEPSLQPLFSCLFVVSQSHSLGKYWKGLPGVLLTAGTEREYLGQRNAPRASRAESWVLTFDLFSVFFFLGLDFVMGNRLCKVFHNTSICLERNLCEVDVVP